MDEEASAETFAFNSRLPAAQPVRCRRLDNHASSTSETEPGGSVGRPCLQSGGICIIRHQGSISTVASSPADAQPNDCLCDVSSKAMESANVNCEKVHLLSAAIGSRDSEAPVSKSSDTYAATHAAMMTLFSEEGQRLASLQIDTESEAQFFTSVEQLAGDPCLQGGGRGSSARSETLDSANVVCYGERNERNVSSAAQPKTVDVVQNLVADEIRACEESRERLAHTENISRPLLIHACEETHVCSECGQRFSSKSNMRTHMLTHARKKPHTCTECGLRFSIKSRLRRHMLTHTGEKPHTCTECGRRFSDESNMKRHMLIHTRETFHTCSECGRRFSNKGSMTMHMLTHAKKEPHTCSQCGQWFSHKRSIGRHMLIHATEKSHACDECGRRFTVRCNMLRHMLTHTGEKPHSCNECGQRFSHKSSVKTHMLIHTGEKPHVCDECGLMFSDRSAMRRHVLTHKGKRTKV